MIFLDTSAVYALASRTDPNHETALRRFERMLASGEAIMTHNYVLVESLALLQSRLGLRSAAAFERDTRWLEVEWITADLHAEAVGRWASSTRGASFVDHVSFLMMERRRIELAFAFDSDFVAAGFSLFA